MVSNVIYSAENAAGIIQGQLDTELNEAGRYQAVVVGKALKDAKFTHAFTSDSHRAVDVRSS